MMYQSSQPIVSKLVESSKNKEQAKISLINMGFSHDIVESVVKTIPNVDNLTCDIIIEKSMVFLNKSFF